MKKKILITGSSGFIASSLIDKISQTNEFEILCLSREKTGNNYFNVKENNFQQLLNNKQFQNIDIAINFAGYIPKPEKLDETYKCSDANVGYLNEFLKFCVQKKIPKFIQISSMSIFEGLKNQIISENTTPNPETRYSQSKLAAEFSILALRKKFKKGIIILRPGFTYGSKMNKSRIIPFFIQNLKKNLDLDVFNSNQIIPLTYIDDLINLILILLDSSCDVEIINVLNEEISKSEIVKILKKGMNSDSKIKFFDNQKLDVNIRFDNSYFLNYIEKIPLKMFSINFEKMI